MGEKGITFVEMMVVIVIIAVLSSLTSVGAYCTVANADASSDRISGNLVTDAVSVYYHANGEFPLAGQEAITEEEVTLIEDNINFPLSGISLENHVYRISDEVGSLLEGENVDLENYLVINTGDEDSRLDGTVVRLDGSDSCTGERWVVGMGTTRGLNVDSKLQNNVGEEYWEGIKNSLEEE